jgi:hypothetical protein
MAIIAAVILFQDYEFSAAELNEQSEINASKLSLPKTLGMGDQSKSKTFYNFL